MRKLTLALAALAVSMCGCRLFDGHPSRSYRYPHPGILTGMPAAVPVNPSGK